VSGIGLAHCLSWDELLAGEALRVSRKTDTGELRTLLPGASLRRVPHFARMALLAAVRALRAAGKADSARTALALGTAYGSSEMNMDFMDSVLEHGPRLSSPTAFSHAVNNMGAGMISLLLDIRGPCLTISQFELSFAGALAAGRLLLQSGRADRVLVGAADETDARFAACCPQVAGQGIAQTEGAVFLCLDASRPADVAMDVEWGVAAADDALVLLSGGAQGPGRRNAPVYGHTPLAQALDCCIGISLLRAGATRRVRCSCADIAHKRQAHIVLRS
jgi:hypothetical protein